jgi:cell division protein FtsB
MPADNKKSEIEDLRERVRELEAQVAKLSGDHVALVDALTRYLNMESKRLGKRNDKAG